MKTILALSFLVIATAAHAGPSVSGGIAFQEDFESCVNKKLKTTLDVRAIVTPSNIVGVLVEGKNATTLNCVEGNNSRSPITGEEVVFKCDEQRAGEGQIQVYVTRNFAGLKYATTYRKDILQRPAKMYTMKCDQFVSNR